MFERANTTWCQSLRYFSGLALLLEVPYFPAIRRQWRLNFIFGYLQKLLGS
jgi:hypothetical protein